MRRGDAPRQERVKRCSKCGVEKDSSEFHLCRSRKDGIQRTCKCCARANSLQRYSEGYRSNVSQKVLRYVSFIKNYKGKFCPRCRVQPEAGVDLHHIDPTTKLFSLGNNSNYSRTGKEILAELAKCIRLCALCHYAEHKRLREKSHTGGTNHEQD